MLVAPAASITGTMLVAVVSTFGPMIYLMPSWYTRRSAPDTASLGSFLSSMLTILILYFSPLISTPPLSLYIWAVASAQYLLTSPHEAAGPLITPNTPILRIFSSAALPMA